ncbi:MAG: DUF1385 domain-containing protein [Coriobacteriales bacterium]|jgi:uncharacterized protein YqhQ|nr:DUF1385 domain-containing protein [Coriobacteriales bacterium]
MREANQSTITPESAMSAEESTLEIAGTNRPTSDWQKARDTEGVVCQTHIGGQALLEGIMMRGRYNWAVAVRRPDGSIYTEQHDLSSGRQKNSWMYWPVIRGCTAMVESLALGYQALQIASETAFNEAFEASDRKAEAETESEATSETPAVAPIAAVLNSAEPATEPVTPIPDTAEPDTAEPDTAKPAPSAPAIPEQTVKDSTAEDPAADTPIPKALITVSLIVGLLLGIFIFVALPAIITNLLIGDYGDRTLLWNLVDGFLRIVIFITYIWLIGKMSDIKRMFGYHGAEHKTIHCYEHGLELTPANTDLFPTLHVRCGTAFMLMTMLVAILVFTITPIAPLIDALGVTNAVLRFTLVVVSRIILIPLIAGLSYEITVKWAGSRPEHPLVQIVLWPGMQLQRLTTRQPDHGQVECAIIAMQLVLQREQRESETSGTA